MRVRDLIRLKSEEGEQLSDEDRRRMIEDIAWQHKQKFWTKIGDEYIKKEGE